MKTHKSLSAYLSRGGIVLSMMFFFSQRSLATIMIVNTNGANPNQCDGSIEVLATGTANPFELYIVGDNGHVEFVPDVNGLYIFDNLCSGNYTIDVLNPYGCKAILSATVFTCSTISIQSPSTNNPSSCNDNDGFLRFNTGPAGGTYPYSYEWSNGSTELWQFNLSAGIYTLTITDSQGCMGEFSYTLTADGAPLYISDVTHTCIGESNCIIGVALYNPEPSLNFEYNWSAGVPYTPDPFYSEIANLPAGSYSVTINETNSGCETILSFTVQEIPDTGPLTVNLVQNSPSCFNASTGIIDITVNGGSPPYRLEADNGKFVNNCWGTATITEFSGGSHEIKVIDECGRVIIGTINIEELPQSPYYFEIVTTAFSHTSTYFSPDGYISVSTVPEGNHTYVWSNGATGNTITGLHGGDYTVSVTGEDGCTRVAKFKVDDCSEFLNNFFLNFEVQVENQLLFNQTANFTAYIDYWDVPDKGFTDEYQNFSVVWQSQNGDILGYGPHFTLQLPEGWDAYFFEAVVSNGCYTKIISVNALSCEQASLGTTSNFFIVEENRPCTNFSDGSVLLQIPNLEGENVTAIFDGLELPLDQSTDPILYSINGLTHGVNYNFQIQIGDICNVDFDYALKPKAPDWEFVEINEDDQCVYDESCNGIPLGQTLAFPEYDYGNATNWPCRINRYCGSEYIDSKSTDKVKVRGMQYYLILLAAHEYGPWDGGYVQHLIERYFDSGDVDYCDMVRYCPYTLEKTFQASTPAQGNYKGFSVDPETGCRKVDCGLVGDYNFCDFGFPTEVFPDFDLDLNDCIPVRRRLYELIIADNDDLLDDIPGYEDSELQHFIEENAINPAAKCAYVTFCCIGGGIDVFDISYSELSEMEEKCGTYGNAYGLNNTTYHVEYCDSELDLSGTYESVWCEFSGISYDNPRFFDITAAQVHFNLHPVALNPPIPFCDGDNFTGGGGNNHLLITNDFSNIEDLSTFGFIKSDGVVYPKGIIKTEAETNFYDFSPTNSRQHKSIIPEILFYYDDWDSGEFVYVESVLDKQSYNVSFENDVMEWITSLRSDNFIEIFYTSISGENLFVGGTYIGNLFIGTSNAATTEEQTAFIIKISLINEIIEIQEIKNIDGNYPTIFTKNDNGHVSIIGKPADGWVAFNDEVQTLDGNTGLFIAQMNEFDGQLQMVNTFTGNSPMKLLAVANSSDGVHSAVAFSTLGTVSLDESQIISQPNGNSLVIAGLGANGTMLWYEVYDCSLLDCEKFDLSYGDNNDLFVGMTFNNDLTINGNQVLNHGGSDIAIVKYNLQGTVEWVKSYGESEDESISELFFNNGNVYFGGNTSGQGGPKVIGNLEIFNFSGFEDRVFISYTLDDPTDGQLIIGENQKNELLKEGPSENAYLLDVLNVYPNPFTNELNVEIVSETASQITLQVISSLGQTLYEEKRQVGIGKNYFIINMGDGLPPGLSYLLLKDESGNQSAKKIFHSKRK